MDFSAAQRSGFWKRHSTKLPGSVKHVPGKLGTTGTMIFGAQYSHATSVQEVERLRALRMDDASWAMEHASIGDDLDVGPDYYYRKVSNDRSKSKDDSAPQDSKEKSRISGDSLAGRASSCSFQSPQIPSTMSLAASPTSASLPRPSLGSIPETLPSSELGRTSGTFIDDGSTLASVPPSPGTNTHTSKAESSIHGMKVDAGRILLDPLVTLQGVEYQSAASISQTNISATLASSQLQANAPTLTTPQISTEGSALHSQIQQGRFTKFKDLLQSPVIDLESLRKLSWSGIPRGIRPMVWQLLVGYLPCNADRRTVTLERKRKEYRDGVQQTFAKGIEGLDQVIWHQVFIDVPRTNPKMKLFQNQATQRCLERILYCWAIRHPASSYVQGINDLVTPFFLVFLSAYLEADQDPEDYDVSLLPEEILAGIEADSFWCLSKLLDGIQDNYTHAQPGIQRQIVKLRELIMRIDQPLAVHLQKEQVEFIQFSFRWMNCLLMREVTLQHTIRMWDTYLTEHPHGFSEFHLYVCAAFLTKWSVELLQMEFQEIMLFLQDVPTEGWQEKDIELLLSEAFMWKSLFHSSPMHLGGAK